MTEETTDIDKAEFDNRVEDIETEADPDPNPEGELMSFSELLDLRESITEADQNLDEVSGYFAAVAGVLEEQSAAATARGNEDKAEALAESADRAEALVERIDGGDALDE